ncbi:hypothetical protein [Peterkaempfera sp. SMS 1(5)a]|uniref:hypothetical protein n=1 Tax=Peterkaempfera podocarpi TaxID=3232308 RepID=UPI00366F73AB
MKGSEARRAARARRLAVCILLLGLFLMHGAPASAATGCHNIMSDPASVAVPPVHPGSTMPTLAGAGRSLQHSSAASTVTAGPSTPGMGGAVCLSTPARGGLPLPAPSPVLVAFLVAVLGALSLASRPLGPSAPGLRAPPSGGRALLLQVCVART